MVSVGPRLGVATQHQDCSASTNNC